MSSEEFRKLCRSILYFLFFNNFYHEFVYKGKACEPDYFEMVTIVRLSKKKKTFQ